MMGKQFATKRGSKRHKKPDKIEISRRARKNQRLQEENVAPPTPSPADEQDYNGDASEQLVSQHPSLSVYDTLLTTLGSTSKSLANAYKQRQRQAEGKSDSEEEETNGSESHSVSEDEEDGENGTDNGSLGSHAMESRLQEPGIVGFVEQREDAETEDGSEVSDTDEEHDLDVSGQSAIQASACTSSFDKHLEYKLSKEEVEILINTKWKYNWEVPDVVMSNCKWIGTGECFLKDGNMNSDHCLKPKLYKHWLDVYKTSGGNDFYSSKQRWFFSLCNSYRDILHSNKKPFYLKGLEEDSTIMDAYLIHSLNHIFRTRDIVKKNNAKLARHKENAEEEVLTGDGFLDQGFTRPKVLILLPLRRIAFRVVKRLIQLTPEVYKVNVEHIDRFCNEFGPSREDEGDEGNNGLSQNILDIGNSKSHSKPPDFQALFGMNRDAEDNLMIGIKFTRRSIRLFNNFYSSDVIVASPVKLLNEIQKAKENKELDVDYLSSIEVLIIDHADVISMQNWSFLNSVVEQVNRIPSKQHGTDVMRIRQCYLDGNARFYRQTIVLGHYSNPDINGFFSHHCVNYQGKVKLVSEYKGVLPKVLLQVQQIYERFNVESISDVDDARLEYFAKKVFPKIKDSIQGGIMLFISSYFEFVRLRNFLKSQNASFCLIGDYAKPSDISRARESFFKGTRKIMLYTERFHFNYRYKIRGIQNVIFYSLPERKEFYPEIVNMLEGSHNMTCTVLFSRFDQLQLERIVGSSPAKRMVKSEKGVFVFC